ncbi:MAG: 23S rRNA (guanosine(2251)-2'-O)-methyltransferase RlmB [Deltaproteobacteria bacterium]|nr:23S rRNA (guanosine(2251)-2'-O)-methyltransferase RlmB [Deltaproteobacteria bacterium]
MSRVVSGVNPVREALAARPDQIEVVCYASKDQSRLSKLLESCKKARVKVSACDKKQLDRFAGSHNHQGIAAIISDFSYSEIDDILNFCKKSGEKAFILVLDGIQDPHNLGAIIRSAESAGIHGIIIPTDRAVHVTSTVEKVSAGAVEHIKIAKVTNIARTLEDLKKEGLWIIGAEGGSRTCLYDVDLTVHVVIVVGSEGKGVRPLVQKKCDIMVNIPMAGKINSLNVSVSSAIIMYEAVRQRL